MRSRQPVCSAATAVNTTYTAAASHRALLVGKIRPVLSFISLATHGILSCRRPSGFDIPRVSCNQDSRQRQWQCKWLEPTLPPTHKIRSRCEMLTALAPLFNACSISGNTNPPPTVTEYQRLSRTQDIKRRSPSLNCCSNVQNPIHQALRNNRHRRFNRVGVDQLQKCTLPLHSSYQARNDYHGYFVPLCKSFTQNIAEPRRERRCLTKPQKIQPRLTRSRNPLEPSGVFSKVPWTC